MSGNFIALSALLLIPNISSPPRIPTSAEIADRISKNPNIELAESHLSGVIDLASAKSNIDQALNGNLAKRSDYGNAPGGSVQLNQRMLWGLLMIGDQFKIRVSEIAGGNHSPQSRHYAGIAFDVDKVNGSNVSSVNNYAMKFAEQCIILGASEVLKPGDEGHAGHIHCAWPR
ncbi:hypothetical protein [Deinococcus aquaticus]|uniref:hypothetical protein n=1 Tax=Deinococcus aquaticus TaxID=328692 RepID=UPI003F46F0DE